MPWSWAAGMKWVPIRPLVDQPQIQKVRNSAQNVQRRLTLAQGPRAPRLRRPVRRGRPAARRTTSGAPYGSSPTSEGRSRMHQQHHRHEQQRERGHQPGGPAPAGSVGELGDRGQEDQLAGRARGREARRSPGRGGARTSGWPRSRRRPGPAQPVPTPTGTPHSSHSCHGWVITRVSPAPSGDQRQRARHHPPDAEPLHQRRRERRGEAVDHQVEADRPGRGGPGPAELVLERLEQRARSRTGTRPRPPARPSWRPPPTTGAGSCVSPLRRRVTRRV